MVILKAWDTWDVTIADDLHVTCSERSVREWAQTMIDTHELPSEYIGDLSVYHAERIAATGPAWKITTVDLASDGDTDGTVY